MTMVITIQKNESMFHPGHGIMVIKYIRTLYNDFDGRKIDIGDIARGGVESKGVSGYGLILIAMRKYTWKDK